MPDFTEIEHLDFNVDRISKVALAASEFMQENEIDVDQAVMVLREEGGGVRVFWLGHPDHAFVTLNGAVNTMANGLQAD